MDSINVREKEEYYDLEGTRLDLMKGLSKMNTRKLEMRKVRNNMDSAVTSLCTAKD